MYLFDKFEQISRSVKLTLRNPPENISLHHRMFNDLPLLQHVIDNGFFPEGTHVHRQIHPRSPFDARRVLYLGVRFLESIEKNGELFLPAPELIDKYFPQRVPPFHSVQFKEFYLLAGFFRDDLLLEIYSRLFPALFCCGKVSGRGQKDGEDQRKGCLPHQRFHLLKLEIRKGAHTGMHSNGFVHLRTHPGIVEDSVMYRPGPSPHSFFHTLLSKW